MSGTTQGGKKAAKTNLELHGEDFYAKVGAIGGKAKVKTKGWGSYSPSKLKRLFGAKNQVAVEYGRRGGTISKRGKAHAN